MQPPALSSRRSPRVWMGLAAFVAVAGASSAIAAADGFDARMAEAMTRMHHAMMLPPFGDPDRDFAAMMIPHHQGAIDMARVELQYGKDPAIKSLAEGIIKAQEAEIAMMREWLKKNGH